MRSTKVRMLLENLEGRALLTTYVHIVDNPVQVVADNVGTATVNLNLTSTDMKPPTAATVTLKTSGGTAVPGVDYTPVQQTITLTADVPNPQFFIPILPGPASLGTRTLVVTVSPTPESPQGQAEYIVIQHGTGTSLPSPVRAQALTQNGKVVAFSLQFNKSMAIGPVTNTANYAVANSKTFKLGKEIGYTGYSKSFALKTAIYNAATDTVYLVPANTLKPSSRLKIVDSASFNESKQFSTQSLNNLRLIFNGISNLTDTSGNPISNEGTAYTAGRFATTATVTKADASLLTYLFGTTAPVGPMAKPNHSHKAK